MTQPRMVAAPVPAGNGLAKALLINTSTGTGFPVMYNPEELVLEQGNTFAEIPVPGLNASPVQYIRGKARSLHACPPTSCGAAGSAPIVDEARRRATSLYPNGSITTPVASFG